MARWLQMLGAGAKAAPKPCERSPAVNHSIQQGEFTIMKQAFIGLIFTFALVLSACTSEPAATTTTAPSPSPVAAAAPEPTATPVDYVAGLMTAKTGIEKALADVKAKDYTAAVESLDGAHKGLTGLSASAPVLLKGGLETAGKGIETAKALVEKKDKGAEKSLTGLVASLTKLTDTAKTADGGVAGMADAAGSMLKGAAGAAKDAAAGAGAAMKGAVEKAAPAEKKN
jgi:hypothetical protein